MNRHVRTALPSDAVELAPRLRAADLAEIEASTGGGALAALEKGYRESLQPVTFMAGERPCGLSGIVPMAQSGRAMGSVGPMGFIWLLGSSELTRDIRWFHKVTAELLEEHRGPWERLVSSVDERHVESLRWLEHLGFVQVGRSAHFGVGRLPFVHVELAR